MSIGIQSKTTRRAKQLVTSAVVRSGVEIRHKFRPLAIVLIVVAPAALFGFLLYFRGDLPGDDSAYGTVMASLPAISLSMTGMLTVSSQIMVDQENGTILRAKVLPYGMSSYIASKIAALFLANFLTVLLLFLVMYFFSNVEVGDPVRVFLLVFPLSLFVMLCVAPIGVLLGAISPSQLWMLPVMFVGYLILSISGVLFPIDFLPDAVAAVAKVFPIYWLGEITRPLLAPNVFGSVEYKSLLVPVLWFVGGLAFAPRALSVLSRRQSGSRLAQIQGRRLRQGY